MTTSLSHNKTDLPSSEGNSNTDGGEEREYNVYACMEPEDWKKVGGRAQAHTIATNITDEELAALKGGRGDVWFESVFEWMLPTFGGDDGNNPTVYFEFIAQRMPNYMIYIILTKDFKPR